MSRSGWGYIIGHNDWHNDSRAIEFSPQLGDAAIKVRAAASRADRGDRVRR
jgi:hypothetical protein